MRRGENDDWQRSMRHHKHISKNSGAIKTQRNFHSIQITRKRAALRLRLMRFKVVTKTKAKLDKSLALCSHKDIK